MASSQAAQSAGCSEQILMGINGPRQWLPGSKDTQTAISTDTLQTVKKLTTPVPTSAAAKTTHEAESTPFQTNYFSENLVVSEIEPRPLNL
jgi:hypothetical protein